MTWHDFICNGNEHVTKPCCVHTQRSHCLVAT